MPDLPTLAVVKYGPQGSQYTFSTYTSTRITPRPIPDRAKRTTMCVEYAIECTTTIMAGSLDTDKTDATIAEIRKKLTFRGGHLTITGMGFTDIDINQLDGTIRDVSYGPHPEIMELYPLGIDKAWFLRWRCTTRIPECPDGTTPAYRLRVMQKSYEWDIVIDHHGFSRRTCSGILEIPANREPLGGRGISDSADEYWFNEVYGQIPLPEGFRRHTSRKLSDDKRILNWTVVDEEMPPTGLVPWCTEWSGSHEASTQLGNGQGMVLVTNVLSASYKASRDNLKSQPWFLFTELVRARRKVETGQNNKKMIFIPISFVVRESLATLETNFVYSYRQILNHPSDFLKATHMWQRVPQATWARWRETTGGSANAARGNANLQYLASHDSIIDLCVPKRTTDVTGMPPDKGGETPTENLESPCEPKEATWVHYEIGIVTEGDTGVVTHKPLPTAPVSVRIYEATRRVRELGKSTFTTGGTGLPGLAPPGGGGVLPGGGILSNSQSSGGYSDDILQVRRSTHTRVRLVGWAMRLCYTIPVPELLYFMGVAPTMGRFVFHQQVIGLPGGMKANIAVWDVEYLIPGYPSVGDGITYPDNPLFGGG